MESRIFYIDVANYGENLLFVKGYSVFISNETTSEILSTESIKLILN